MILFKTFAGQQVLKDRTSVLTQRQRSAFILFDGQRRVEDVLVATAALGISLSDVEHMVGLGLLSPSKTGGPTSLQPDVPLGEGGATGATVASGSGRSLQQRYSEAYPIAIELTASLGLKGFRLNLAVEAAGGFAQLSALAPKIREAVGADKYERLHRALHD